MFKEIIFIPGFAIGSKYKIAQLTKFFDNKILYNLCQTNKNCLNIFKSALKIKKFKYDICKQGSKLKYVMHRTKLMRSTRRFINNEIVELYMSNGLYFTDHYTLLSEYDATYKNVKYQKIKYQNDLNSKYSLNTYIDYLSKYNNNKPWLGFDDFEKLSEKSKLNQPSLIIT